MKNSIMEERLFRCKPKMGSTNEGKPPLEDFEPTLGAQGCEKAEIGGSGGAVRAFGV